MAITKKPYYLTIKEASSAISTGELTSLQLVNSCLERIDTLEGKIQAWALVDREGALEAAHRLDKELQQGQRRGPLHGIPMGIKDIFYTTGLRTEAGSPSWSGFIPSYDATTVTRLKEAGAIVLGKTHTTQFAYFDPAPTHNPWNTAHTPGGSSSGSGAGVAAGTGQSAQYGGIPASRVPRTRRAHELRLRRLCGRGRGDMAGVCRTVDRRAGSLGSARGRVALD